MSPSRIPLIFAITLIALVPGALIGQRTSADTSIMTAIASLDGPWWAESLPNFEPFYRSPARAAELLIQSLKPVAEGNYWQQHQPAVAWRIRALRSLTGLDFRSHTHRKITEDDSLPQPDCTGQIPFFELASMGWDRIVVAPVDVQEHIIALWRSWFEHYGRTFKYVNERREVAWYF